MGVVTFLDQGSEAVGMRRIRGCRGEVGWLWELDGDCWMDGCVVELGVELDLW